MIFLHPDDYPDICKESILNANLLIAKAHKTRHSAEEAIEFIKALNSLKDESEEQSKPLTECEFHKKYSCPKEEKTKAGKISKTFNKNFLKCLARSGDRGLRLAEDYEDRVTTDDFHILTAIIEAFGATMEKVYKNEC